MSSAIARRKPPAQPWPNLKPENRFVIEGVSWQEYEAMLEWAGDRPLRITYDHGRLELMSPLVSHEQLKKSLGAIVELLLEELGISFCTIGSMTMRRQDLKRGLEPDDCFYIKRFRAVEGRKELDFNVDPPPDLVIEIDITSSSIDRIELYASLKVPEVWRFDGQQLHFLKLSRASKYSPTPLSSMIPGAAATDIGEWLRRSFGNDQLLFRRAFRAWVRKTLVAKRRPRDKRDG
jgi:Uma2 family endonuclease